MLSHSSERARRGTARSPGIHESGEEGVAFGAVYETALSFDRTSDESVMVGQNGGPERTEHRRQSRRTLDVGEKKGDRAFGRPRRLLHAESLNLDDDFDWLSHPGSELARL